MDRELKFRMWDGKKMHYSEDVVKYGAARIRLNSLPLKCLKNSEHEKWMQYTGLTDRHEHEIYEGDIVKGRYFPTAHLVEWEHHGFYPLCSDEYYDEPLVVGNIYQNPELLHEDDEYDQPFAYN